MATVLISNIKFELKHNRASKRDHYKMIGSDIELVARPVNRSFPDAPVWYFKTGAYDSRGDKAYPNQYFDGFFHTRENAPLQAALAK